MLFVLFYWVLSVLPACFCLSSYTHATDLYGTLDSDTTILASLPGSISLFLFLSLSLSLNLSPFPLSLSKVVNHFLLENQNYKITIEVKFSKIGFQKGLLFFFSFCKNEQFYFLSSWQIPFSNFLLRHCHLQDFPPPPPLRSIPHVRTKVTGRGFFVKRTTTPPLPLHG